MCIKFLQNAEIWDEEDGFYPEASDGTSLIIRDFWTVKAFWVRRR